jgi:16S rRNA (guanine527-N7)-methyltransferase
VSDSGLAALIDEAQRRGFVGPGPASRQIDHAVDLAALLGPGAPRILDLGSGGGLPGLVLLDAFPDSEVVLLDAHQRRCAFLREAIVVLGVESRCSVVEGRAESLAHEPGLRGGFDLVVARAFGPPATTAECAVGFLSVGASLVVSEPPDEAITTRWPDDGLALLGLAPADRLHHGMATAAKMTLEVPVLKRWPRRVGVPSKRPLWTS